MNSRSSEPLAALSSERPDALSELALAREADAIWVDWRCTLYPEEIGSLPEPEMGQNEWGQEHAANGRSPSNSRIL